MNLTKGSHMLRPGPLVMLLVTLLSTPLFAQETRDAVRAERNAILTTVQTFLETMAAKNIAGARRVLLSEGRFFAVGDEKGKANTRTFTHEDYLKDLSAAKHRVRERIWNPQVRLHGAIATVWAEYDYWSDGKFSHCGVNAFTLLKTAEGWKISGGSFTLERKCRPSPLGPLKQ